jgi:hypothetical protein
MDWMIIEPSLEAQLNLECTCRGIREATDLAQMQELCVALTQQNFHQSLLLKQAVTHIGALESGMLRQE